MSSKNMHHELEMIDGAIAELEDRRTQLINQMSSPLRSHGLAQILYFPDRILVRRSPRGSGDDWPKGLNATSPDKDRP
jgi:hypothetical protein